VGSGRQSRRIPWREVGRPEWAWYSFDAPGSLRIAYVDIAEGEKRIYYWADDDSVERLLRMREEALTSRPTQAKEVEVPAENASPQRPARPPFPYAFVPLVLALVAVVNLLVVMLQGGHAAGAATFVVILIVILTLVFALRARSNG
jgi:hypothetical protein